MSQATTWSSPDPSDVVEAFTHKGALILDHFVYASGKHGAAYVAKDELYPDTGEFAGFAGKIAYEMLSTTQTNALIDTVVGVAPIANVLGFLVSSAMSQITGRPVYAIAAEKKPVLGDPIMSGDYIGERIYRGDRLYLRNSFQRFVDPLQTVLIVEDIVNSGKTVRELVQLLKALGAADILVAALWSRGGQTAETLGVSSFFSLCDTQYEQFAPEECPLCANGVPVNQSYGHPELFIPGK